MPPCGYEPNDNSSDSYSCADDSGAESEEKLADLSLPPKTTVAFSFRYTCGLCNVMDTSKECVCLRYTNDFGQDK